MDPAHWTAIIVAVLSATSGLIVKATIDGLKDRKQSNKETTDRAPAILESALASRNVWKIDAHTSRGREQVIRLYPELRDVELPPIPQEPEDPYPPKFTD